MNPIIPGLYIILFIVTIIQSLQSSPYRLQENMLLLLPLRPMPNTCLRIFLQDWDFGMNALNQISFLLHLPGAMLKMQELRVIGTKNFMAWTIWFMLTCKREKMILLKNNAIISKV